MDVKSVISVFLLNHGKKYYNTNIITEGSFEIVFSLFYVRLFELVHAFREVSPVKGSHTVFPAAARLGASLNPKFRLLKTHNSNLFLLVGSRKGNGDPSSPCSQIALINDPSGSIIDLL